MIEAENNLFLRVAPLGTNQDKFVMVLRALLLVSIFPITEWYFAAVKTGVSQLVFGLLFILYLQLIGLVGVLFLALPFLFMKKGRMRLTEDGVAIHLGRNREEIQLSDITSISMKPYLSKRLILSFILKNKQELEFELCEHYWLFPVTNSLFVEMNYYKAFSFIHSSDPLSSKYTE